MTTGTAPKVFVAPACSPDRGQRLERHGVKPADDRLPPCVARAEGGQHPSTAGQVGGQRRDSPQVAAESL